MTEVTGCWLFAHEILFAFKSTSEGTERDAHTHKRRQIKRLSLTLDEKPHVFTKTHYEFRLDKAHSKSNLFVYTKIDVGAKKPISH